MAESADILAQPHQQVILPNMEAGCSMADMAKTDDVEACWAGARRGSASTNVVPVTYMNSAASLKAFCGRNGGIVCTSSTPPRVFDWAFERGEQGPLLPRPAPRPQHRRQEGHSAWTRWSSGIPSSPSVATPPEALRAAKVILWKGHCSVHARFTVEQIERARAEYPDVNVIVHPECRSRSCRPPTTTARPSSSSTRSPTAPAGRPGRSAPRSISSAACNTEKPDKTIFCLDPVICPCSTMYRVHPAYVLWSLEHLAKGEIVNQITVDPDIAREALVALDRYARSTIRKSASA